jgi:hypothetical protein
LQLHCSVQCAQNLHLKSTTILVCCTMQVQDQCANQAPPFLPPGIVAQVLQHVPGRRRLLTCARVCKDWAAAARLATVHINSKCRPRSKAQLESFLQQHAGQLLTLELPAHYARDLKDAQLPWAQLTRLERLTLESADLQLPDDAAAAADAGSNDSTGAAKATGASRAAGPLLPALKHLELNSCSISSISSLVRLAQAPQLSSLQISELKLQDHPEPFCFRAPDVQQQIGAALAGLLQQLPVLSVLHLPKLDLNTAAVDSIARMDKLQDLQLILTGDVWALGLQVGGGVAVVNSSQLELALPDPDGNVPHNRQFLHADQRDSLLMEFPCSSCLESRSLLLSALLPAGPVQQHHQVGTKGPEIL